MNYSFNLLNEQDGPAFTEYRGQSTVPLLIVADHASNAIPQVLNNLGLSDQDLAKHIAWDIGAAKVARALSQRFNACLIESNYSRLVIDCNRYTSDPASIVTSSDSIDIPGNQLLSTVAIERRIREIYIPYHRAINRKINWFLSLGLVPIVLSVHSMAAALGGKTRQENIAICWCDDDRLPKHSLRALNQMGIKVGDNVPYAQIIGEDYTVPEHALARGLPSLMVEFRQDLIGDASGVELWAKIFGDVLQSILEENYSFRHCS